MNASHPQRRRILPPSTRPAIAAAVLRRAQALVLLAVFAVTLLAPGFVRADIDHDFDCLPNQPGCLPNGEFYVPFQKPAAELTWALKKRGNLWVNAWRSHQNNSKSWKAETYDPRYVHPTNFEAQFTDQCQTEADWDYFYNGLAAAESQAGTYRWSVNGVVQVSDGDCVNQTLNLPGQGIHDVKLEVFAPGASTPYLTKTTTARVRDYLIVLMGDSAASGEGSPDFQRASFAENGTWVDRRCHRSANAAVPRAIEELEYDPHSTVTFLNFACSGATLDLWEPGQGGGILAPYAGIEPTEEALVFGDNNPFYYLPAQVDQLERALRWGPNDQYIQNPRKVDMLLTTGGINDVRFSKLALACVLLEDCHNQFTSLYGSGANAVKFVFDDLASGIAEGYVELRNFFETAAIEVDKTYVMQYPGAFEKDNGGRCTSMLEDVLPASSVWNLILNPLIGPPVLSTTLLGPFLEHELGINFPTLLGNALVGNLRWSADEIDWMVEEAMPRLDKAVREGAEAAGFEFVDGVQKAFAKHGYCANDNWIRRGDESSFVQGPWNIVSKPLNTPPLLDPTEPIGLGIQAMTKGLMHPGSEGYAAWANVLWPTMMQLWNRAPTAVGEVYTVDTSINASFTTPPFSEGVLSNDVDPNGDPMRSVLLLGPKNGTVEFGNNGHLKYTPNPGFRGFDSLYYRATDGGLTSNTVKVTFRVGSRGLGRVPQVIIRPGETVTIGSLVAHTQMAGPYEVRFDGEIPVDWGILRPIPGRDGVYFTAPESPAKRRFVLHYTVRSLTTDRTSPDFGRSLRGAVRIRIGSPR